MNPTTRETRRASHESVDKAKRYGEIKEALQRRGAATAKEIAVYLYNTRRIPSTERNYTAPRLTELERKGEVEVTGKKPCQYTGKTVAIYRLREH